MNIDLGYLGKVVLDGYTEAGIRVHGVFDCDNNFYPTVWCNAILIKVGN